MKRSVIALLIVALLCTTGFALAEDAGIAAEDFYLMLITGPGQLSESWHQMTGFQGLACKPEDFAALIKKTMDFSDPVGSNLRYHEALSSLGFSLEGEMGWFFEGYPSAVEILRYGDVPSIDGQQSLSIVLLRMGGYRMLAVFLRDDAGWRLTDWLYADDFGIEDTAYIPLLTRDDGSPGAWLLMEAVGHGTGCYVLIEQWYNVFTGVYEVKYEREGWDNIGMGDGGSYWYALLMDMPVKDMKLPAALPFTRWTSCFWMNGDTNAADAMKELARHITTGQYAYDESTASYALRDWAVIVDAVAPSPATGFFLEPGF